jgi:hypothetical protein
MLRVPQEIAFTVGGLSRVLLFAAIGFATMALLLDEEHRPVAVVMGALAAGAISLMLAYLIRQQRFGTATLIAERAFELDRPFAGTIVTGLHPAPDSTIRIRISCSHVRSTSTLARTTVDPLLLRQTPDGSLAIPFQVPPPDEPTRWKPSEVRLHVRTASWPIGWGATFVIARSS